VQTYKSLNRRFAIIFALVCLWLLTCIGVFIFIAPHNWLFFDLHGYDESTIGQIGGFFLAWTAAQLPAASVAGMVIGSSDFSHPLRTTFLTVTAYYLLLSTIRVFHWPWNSLKSLDQSIPCLAYLVSLLLLICVSVFFAWVMPRFSKVFQNHLAKP
jgi:hypothetical protein